MLYSALELKTYAELNNMTYADMERMSDPLYFSSDVICISSTYFNFNVFLSLTVSMIASGTTSASYFIKRFFNSAMTSTGLCSASFLKKIFNSSASTATGSVTATFFKKLFSNVSIVASSNVTSNFAILVKMIANMVGTSMISAIAKTNLITSFIYKDVILAMVSKANISINKMLNTQTLIHTKQDASISVTERYNTIQSVTKEHKSEVEVFIDKEVSTKI